MSDTVNETNIDVSVSDTSNTEGQNDIQNSDNTSPEGEEYILTDEQNKVIELLAREEAIKQREKALEQREKSARATNILSQIGFNEDQQKMAFKFIDFTNLDTIEKSISGISELCDARALDIVNERLRSKTIPKAFDNSSFNINKNKTSFASEVNKLQNK